MKKEYSKVKYCLGDGAQLLSHLLTAAERYAISSTGDLRSHTLWSSPFMMAIAVLLSQTSSLDNDYDPRGISTLPILCLFLLNYPDDVEQFSRKRLSSFLWDILYSKLAHETSNFSIYNAREYVKCFLDKESQACSWPSRYNPGVRLGICRVLTLGLDNEKYDDRRVNYLVRRAVNEVVAQWIINHLAKLPIKGVSHREWPLRAVLDGFSYVLDGLRAALLPPEKLGSRSNDGLMTPPIPKLDPSGYALEWLTFIWREINNAIYESMWSELSPDPWYTFPAESILDPLCFAPVRLLLRLDHLRLPRRYMHHHAEISQDSASSGGSSWEQKRCTILCRFRGELTRSIYLTRICRAPEASSYSGVWKELEDLLCNTKSQDYDESHFGKWTTADHRDGVRREIFKALKSAVQRAQNSGVFDRLSSLCLTSLNILYNHNQRPVAKFNHIHTRNTHQQ